MVARLRPGKRHDGGRKEHGLVIGVGNEEADALVAQGREARRHHRGGVDVQRREHDGGHAEGREPVHRAPGQERAGECGSK